MEEFALVSHRRAVRAIDEGYFAAEIAPYGDVAADECPRRDTSLERMAGLQPLRADGRDHRCPLQPDRRAAAALLIA